MAEIITSLQNPKVKAAARLKERRERNKTQRFLIEGCRELLRYHESPLAWEALEQLFICPELFLSEEELAVVEWAKKKDTPILELNKAVFEKLSYRDRPDGLLGIAKQPQRDLATLKLKKNPLVVIAESIEKPGNLGTILRASDAAGVDAIIVCERCTDLWNPNVVRASIGTLFTQAVVEAPRDEVIAWLKKEKLPLLAATPHAEQNLWQSDLASGVAIAVGCEQLGLSDELMSLADKKVKIPMYGLADSLNVAIATSLMLYEARRQQEA